MSKVCKRNCQKCIRMMSKDWLCPCYFDCPYFGNNYNVIYNKFTKNLNEIIVYKKEFHLFGNPDVKGIDRSRKWGYNEQGHLVALADDVTLSDLQDTLRDSRKRSLDNFYGYAYSNDWKYFVTLTIDPKQLDRTDRDVVMYAWQLFRQKLQYYFQDIKLLVVNENHQNGGIHLHGFASNCDLKPYLTRAIDTKQYLYDYDYNNSCKVYKLDKFGNKIPNSHYLQPMTNTYVEKDTGVIHTVPVYSLRSDFFTYGFCSVVEIEPGSKTEHISSYMAKYFTKDQLSNVMFEKHSYFATRNLNFKEKRVMKLSEEQMKGFVKGLSVKKETDKFIVYQFSEDEYIKAQGLIEDHITDGDRIFNEFEQMDLKDIF